MQVKVTSPIIQPQYQGLVSPQYIPTSIQPSYPTTIVQPTYTTQPQLVTQPQFVVSPPTIITQPQIYNPPQVVTQKPTYDALGYSTTVAFQPLKRN